MNPVKKTLQVRSSHLGPRPASIDTEEVWVPGMAALAAIFLTGLLYLALPPGVIVGPHWLLLAIEGAFVAPLIVDALALLWCFNILVFALWYWELDGGGPWKRRRPSHHAADFLFPQQANGKRWVPHFLDYLFVAFTGATALSPADTYPLTRTAKVLMMSEAMLSLAVVGILIARAVNILGG